MKNKIQRTLSGAVALALIFGMAIYDTIIRGRSADEQMKDAAQ